MQTKKPFIILVVDDEPPVCELIVRIAQKQFPEARFVNTRSTGETLEYLNNHLNKWPNLVLLDIDLHQNVSGLDFLPQLRSILENKVPIVIFSVLDNVGNIKQAYEEGAASYIQKPSDLQGWQDYIATIRAYWYDTNSAPPRTNFVK